MKKIRLLLNINILALSTFLISSCDLINTGINEYLDKYDTSVSSITLSPPELYFVQGSHLKQAIIATVHPTNATNKDVIWTSSDTSVATVDKNGLVSLTSTAGVGDIAIITVTTVDGGKTATCLVTDVKVEKKVTGVTLNKTTLNLNINESEVLTPTIAPYDATDHNVTWISSNTSVATVDKNGNISAQNAGTTTITVTTEDSGKTATCTVTVNTPKSEFEIDDKGIITKYTGAYSEVVIPSTIDGKKVTGIKASLFTRKNLKSITIPHGVTSIGVQAFEDCQNLESITIPNTVTTIENNAFYKCKSLKSITIPNSVTSIGNLAFASTSLKSIKVEATIPPTLKSLAFEGSPLEEILVPKGCGGNYTNWSGVVSAKIREYN